MFDKMKGLFEMQKKMQEIKRSQEVAAQKMKDVTGFNIPGLT